MAKNKKPLRCRFGFHEWIRSTKHYRFHVEEIKDCKLCGKHKEKLWEAE